MRKRKRKGMKEETREESKRQKQRKGIKEEIGELHESGVSGSDGNGREGNERRGRGE